MNITRLNQHEQPYQIDDRGSMYVDYLHVKLNIARQLADEIEHINPQFPLSPGFLANLKHLITLLR